MVPYTAVMGGRDEVRNDILCFTEKDFDKFRTPRMNARMVKVLSHQWVDADVSVWMDGCVFPRVGIKTLLHLLGDADMFMSLHPKAGGMGSELELLKVFRKGNLGGVREQIGAYLDRGLKLEGGMWWSGFVIRRHNRAVEDFNSRWWAEICRWSERDQIALPYVLDRCPGLRLNSVPFRVVEEMLDVRWHEADG